MNEYRCHNCNHLLFKSEGQLDIEIMCPSCRRFNYPIRQDQNIGLRGKDFQAKAVDHLCYNCTRLQFRSIGIGIIETKCSCGYVLEYDTKKMRSGDMSIPEDKNEQFEKLRQSIAR
jgi:phage FluMu protein Com